MLKKLYNDIDTLVDETIEGFYLSNTPVYSENIPGTRFIVRKEQYRKEKGKVKLVSFGGSAHEPGPFLGVAPYSNDIFIGGDVYAAPAWMQIIKGVKAIDDGSPLLMGVSSHAGDLMNGKLAHQRLRAEGVDIHMYVSWSDVASAPKGQESTRRGIGGCLDRILGNAAEAGYPIEEVIRIAEKARDFNRSYGVGIRGAIHPVTGNTIMPMADDEIELGIGVHGESSGNRMKLPRSKELARMLSDILLEDMDAERGEELVIHINSLGGMTYMEMSILYKDIYRYLTDEKGIKIFHGSMGAGITTQELGGFILHFGRVDDEIKKLWDLR